MPELVVDERGRTSLARVRSQHYNRYLVEEFPDGTLVLTPLVTISAVELAALRDPVVQAAIAAAKSGDQSELRRRPRRSVTSSSKLASPGRTLRVFVTCLDLWPLRPEAELPCRLPGLRHAWPGKHRLSMSAGVRGCRWRLLLTLVTRPCACRNGLDRPPHRSTDAVLNYPRCCLFFGAWLAYDRRHVHSFGDRR
jgi:hypothetical protein